MDILTNKQTKSYDYISRYSSFPIFYNKKDNKYTYGVTAQLQKQKNVVKVPVYDSTTLDQLSVKYYGRPDYYWIIADYNRIQDPFIHLSDYYSELEIPSLFSIEYTE